MNDIARRRNSRVREKHRKLEFSHEHSIKLEEIKPNYYGFFKMEDA